MLNSFLSMLTVLEGAGRSVCCTPNSSDLPSFSKKNEELIVNTLIRAKSNGNAEATLTTWSEVLRQLGKTADLSKPTEVKEAIANRKHFKTHEPVSNQTKRGFVTAYDALCKANGIEWTKPKYKVEETVPIIPTKARVEKIIANATPRSAIAFTLMIETAVEGTELHKTHRNQIDLEQRTIRIIGRKGHGSKSYKLKQATCTMLHEFLIKHPEDYPFTNAKNLGQSWSHARARAAKVFQDPEILKIPMKNLRNYSGAQFYLSMPIRDPWAVMLHFRHKKMQTTQHYLQALIVDGEEDIEYTSKAIQTKEEILKLTDAGYTYVQTTPDGWSIYRKRK